MNAQDTRKAVQGFFGSLVALVAVWIVVVSLAALPGCNRFNDLTGSNGQPTPPPCVSVSAFNCTPISAFAGLYSCRPEPEGAYTANVNGQDQSIEFGQLIVAKSGDNVQACRCGVCTRVSTLR